MRDVAAYNRGYGRASRKASLSPATYTLRGPTAKIERLDPASSNWLIEVRCFPT